MTRREPVWHDDAWFAERGFPPPVSDWERRQPEATVRQLNAAVAAAPPFEPQQVLALRRIFTGIRDQMTEAARDNPGELECSCSCGCTVLAGEQWRQGAIVALKTAPRCSVYSKRL